MSETSLSKLLASHPERVIEQAVRGMLPKNRLGRAMFKKLKVYASGTHPMRPRSRSRWTERDPKRTRSVSIEWAMV